MIVKTDHWVNVNGEWYGPGKEYDNGVPDRSEPAPDETEKEEVQEAQPAKRTRRRKTEG